MGDVVSAAHGNFRDWARLTAHTRTALTRTGRPRVDQEVLRWVFSRLGGSPWERSPVRRPGVVPGGAAIASTGGLRHSTFDRAPVMVMDFRGRTGRGLGPPGTYVCGRARGRAAAASKRSPRMAYSVASFAVIRASR